MSENHDFSLVEEECFLERPLITVAMPVYNSAAMLDITLKAVRSQTLAPEAVEIILLDGGSTDNTPEIAAKYGARIIPNPHKLPEPAKPIAISEAKGRYFVWMGSDEEMLNPALLTTRAALMQRFTQVKCLVYDRETPDPACGPANPYCVRFGDPFSMFAYRVKDGNLATFRRHVTAVAQEGAVLSFQAGDMKPIGDGSATFDLDYLRQTFGERYREIDFANRLFDETIDATGCCGIATDDRLCHHAAGRMKTYLSKLRFRVINNVFAPAQSGYSARQVAAPVMNRRRKLFYLYALTLVGPLWHSVALAVSTRDPRMLLHGFYTYYVCFFAAYCLLRKAMGQTMVNGLYGK